MELKHYDLMKQPSFRRSFAAIALLVTLLFTLFFLWHQWTMNRLIESADARIAGLSATLWDQSPDLGHEMIRLLTESPVGADLDRGREILRRYGYGTGQRGPLGESLRAASLPRDGIVFAILVVLGGFFVFLVSGSIFRNHVRKLSRLLDDLERRRISVTPDSEGIWSLIYARLGQLLGSTEGVSRHLKGSLAILEQTIEDISHQLKTPLSTLTINVDLLRSHDDLSAQERRGLLDRCSRQLDRMHRLIRYLLSEARLDAGAVEFRSQNLDVVDLVSQAIESVQGLFEERTVDFRRQGGTPPGISGDGTWLIEAFGNILTNSIRHTAVDGSITVELSWTPLFLRLSFHDDGPGIPQNLLPRIFERFRGTSVHSAEGGSGIGLSLARSVVEASGGDIRAANDPSGTGCVFTVTLPRTDNLTES